MRIARLTPLILNVSARTNWFFVKAELSDGTCGYGEGSLNGREPAMLARLDALRAGIEGIAPADARPRLRTRPDAPGGLVDHAVKSAIEQALAAAQARSRGVPLHAWLGPKRRATVRMYANINRATTDRTPEGCARSARAAVLQGFRAVKIAPFDEVRRDVLRSADGPRAIAAGVRRVQAIREAVGPDVDLMVDCHWRFDEAAARDALDRLAPLRLHWFECPVPESAAWHPAIARLRDAAHAHGVLLAGAETETAVEGFAPFVDPPLLDVVMPDVKYAGGVAATLAIAEYAHARGVAACPHNPTGPVCTYASLHVAACATAMPMLELQVGESALYFDVVRGARPALVDGGFVVPDAPGLGVDLDEALIGAHPYRPVPAGPDETLARGG